VTSLTADPTLNDADLRKTTQAAGRNVGEQWTAARKREMV
jgi:hypothetical protein